MCCANSRRPLALMRQIILSRRCDPGAARRSVLLIERRPGTGLGPHAAEQVSLFARLARKWFEQAAPDPVNVVVS